MALPFIVGALGLSAQSDNYYIKFADHQTLLGNTIAVTHLTLNLGNALNLVASS